jgi:RNA polymerase sigma-70 factor (ECF subfamily)
MTQITDAQLIENCQNGEKSSFRLLVDRYKNRAYTVAYRIIGDASEAEDIAQEAFISAYKAIDKFDLDRSFKPWITRIVTNLSIDHLRKKSLKTVPLDSLDFGVEENDSLIDVRYPNPLEMAEMSELQDLVENLIIQLPANYRAVVTLYYNEDFTYSEIADTLDMPMGTVKTYLHRAREILKVKLKDVFRESVLS